MFLGVLKPEGRENPVGMVKRESFYKQVINSLYLHQFLPEAYIVDSRAGNSRLKSAF
jgi:hypothetical protein